MSEDFSKHQTKPEFKLWGLLAAVFVPLGIVAVAQLVSFLIANGLNWPIVNGELETYQTYILAFISICLPIPLMLIYLKRRNYKLSDLGFKYPANKYIWVTILTFLIYIVSMLVVLSLVSSFFPNFNPDQAQDLGLNDPGKSIEYIILFLLLVIFTPLVEESLFRGFMFNGLRRRWGWVVAAIMSAFIFGAIHGQLNVGIDTFIMSLYSAWLFHKSNSIWPSIGLHALKNGLAFMALFLFKLS